MRVLIGGAFLVTTGCLIASSTDRQYLIVGLAGLGLMYLFWSLALLRSVLAPARIPMLYYSRRARRLIAFASGIFRGAETERLGDLLRRHRGWRGLSDAELEEAAARLDRITVAFRAANRRVGPGVLGLGRRLIRRYITRTAEHFQKVPAVLTHRGVLRFFALAFPALYLILVTMFGLAYLAAWKLSTTAFSSVPPLEPSLWHAWFFSMTTVTTSALSALRPEGILAQTLVSLELVSGVAFVGALVTCFASIHQVDLDESVKAWRAIAAELAIVMEHWNDEMTALERERGFVPTEGDV
jgi:hypothetical protein